jgi:hypothetical protein
MGTGAEMITDTTLRQTNREPDRTKVSVPISAQGFEKKPSVGTGKAAGF